LGCHNPDVSNDLCTIHDDDLKCTNVEICDSCAERKEYQKEPKLVFSSSNWQYISTSQMIEDALKLCKHVPYDCTGIVGVPRSGMMAAAAIATMMSKPLYELDVQNGLKKVGVGGRMWFEKIETSGSYFVVDDSVYQGNTMNLAKDLIGHAIFTSVYARPDKSHIVDHYVMELESPHLFEWNLFNNGMVSGECDDMRFKGGIAFDFDGILCPDPSMPDADEGELLKQYLDYLRSAPVTHMHPTLRKIPLIITLRLEKWRSICEEWLRVNGISYDKIVMCPFDHVAERMGEGGIAPQRVVVEHKAKPFAESNCSMMIESDPRQAKIIYEETGKPVLCPQSKQVFYST